MSESRTGKFATRLLGLLLALSVAGLCVGFGWWLAGRQAWTDGGHLRTADPAVKPRPVLWQAPMPLDEAINTPADEYEPAISPDGTELYFVRGKAGHGADILVSVLRNGSWGVPVVVEELRTEYDELGPRLSGDGQTLFFYSDRPGGEGGYDIWASHRGADGRWGKPYNLGPGINSPFDEISPAPTPDGKGIFFATNRKSTPKNLFGADWRGTIRQHETGDYDIFAAKCKLGDSGRIVGEQAAEVASLNSGLNDGACCVSPAGDFLYFASERAGGYGGLDIYRARLNGLAVEAVENLGPTVNTKDNETDPAIGLGGFRLYFSSDRRANHAYDLFVSDSKEVYSIKEPRPIPQTSGSAMVLVTALGVAFTLTTILRTQDTRAILARCLVFSLLLHAMLVSGFSAVSVSKEIIHYVKQEIGMEVPVNIESARLAELQLQLRSQITDLITPAPSGIEPHRPSFSAGGSATPAMSLLQTPRTAPGPAGVTIALSSPTLPVPRPVVERLDLAAPSPKLVLPKVELTPPQVKLVDETPAVPHPPELRTPRPQIAQPQPQLIARPQTPLSDDRIAAAVPMLVPAPLPRVDTGLPMPPVIPGQNVRPATPGSTRIQGADPLLPTQVRTGPPTAGQTSDTHGWNAMLKPPEGPVAAISTPHVAGFSVAPATPRGDNTPADPTPAISRSPVAGPPAPPSELRLAPIVVAPQLAIVPAPAAPTLSIHQPVPDIAASAIPKLDASIGTHNLTLPDRLAQRDPAIRSPLVQAMGGSPETEAAVARSLAYLSRNQLESGRWTSYYENITPRIQRENRHDPALTGLAMLCFLAANHRPDRPGPYRDTTSRGLRYLLQTQQSDGNCRGPEGDMYGQAITTLALSEAALMTHQDQYRQVAILGARYIVEAQNERGCWRYVPNAEDGDLSVTGWQLMALHSAAELNWQPPARVVPGALKWIDSVTTGRFAGLCRYQASDEATPSMTAQGLFGRMLFNDRLANETLAEASGYVTAKLPGAFERDYYRMYCSSLMLMQIQNEDWHRWNAATRQFLLQNQRGDNPADGSWDPDDQKWSKPGGRVASTALATLTLEVYYRYLPMYSGRVSTK